MKIAGKNVKGLVVKRNERTGYVYYGWEPSPAQRRANWTSKQLLARDLGHAIQLCEAHNATVDEWKNGGAAPGKVKIFVKADTLNALIDRYERAMIGRLAKSTREVDKTPIKLLREWAGKHPVKWITRPRVKALRDAMMNGVELNGPGHSSVFHLLTTLRKILGWWIDEDDVGMPNPADRFNLPAPAAREQIWEADAQAIMHEACAALGYPSVARAFDIGTYTGQRQADILGMSRHRWQPITLAQLGHDKQLYDALVSDHGPNAGQVMGINVRQGKTDRWVCVPIEGELRDRIEAAIATTLATAKREGKVPPANIIVRESDGQPWGKSDFIHTFGEIRDAAWAVALCDGNHDLANRLAQLQFRDLRRTCITTLGQLGLNDYQIASISGHSQATIKRILEVYMSRNAASAASAVVARIGDKARRASQQDQEKIA